MGAPRLPRRPGPYSPLGLQHAEEADNEGLPLDADARPTLAEVLVVRAERQATMREVLVELTDERLEEETVPVEGAGYPPAEAYGVRRCLGAIVGEEYWHRQFAERDLAALRAATGPGSAAGGGYP